MRAARILGLFSLGLLALATPAAATPYGVNLLVNGDAESDLGSTSGYEVVPVITGWSRTGNLTLVRWVTGGGFPTLDSPGPAARGANFFAGGPSEAQSQIAQVVDISDIAGAVDAGTVDFRLAAYLGGYATQADQAQFEAVFRDGAALALGSASLGPVTTAERGSLTGLLLRAAQGDVPPGTRTILVRLTCTRLEGSYDDGYADSLSLVLSSSTAGVGAPSAAGAEFAPVAPNPGRAEARFSFGLPRDADVRLEIFDPLGRRVATVLDGHRPAGSHSAAWRRPAGIAAGVYVARLQAGSEVLRRRFVLLD